MKSHSLELLKQKKGIDFNDLTYHYTSKTANISTLIIYNDIKNGQTSLENEEKI